jgi:hypothetical protein
VKILLHLCLHRCQLATICQLTQCSNWPTCLDDCHYIALAQTAQKTLSAAVPLLLSRTLRCIVMAYLFIRTVLMQQTMFKQSCRNILLFMKLFWYFHVCHHPLLLAVYNIRNLQQCKILICVNTLQQTDIWMIYSYSYSYSYLLYLPEIYVHRYGIRHYLYNI